MKHLYVSYHTLLRYCAVHVKLSAEYVEKCKSSCLDQVIEVLKVWTSLKTEKWLCSIKKNFYRNKTKQIDFWLKQVDTDLMELSAKYLVLKLTTRQHTYSSFKFFESTIKSNLHNNN